MFEQRASILILSHSRLIYRIRRWATELILSKRLIANCKFQRNYIRLNVINTNCLDYDLKENACRIKFSW